MQCWHFLTLCRKPSKWRLTCNCEAHSIPSDSVNEVFCSFFCKTISVKLLKLTWTYMVHCLSFIILQNQTKFDIYYSVFKLEPLVVKRLNIKIYVSFTVPKTLELERSKQKTVITFRCHLLSDSLCFLSPQNCL